jgi:hypothetical protein
MGEGRRPSVCRSRSALLVLQNARRWADCRDEKVTLLAPPLLHFSTPDANAQGVAPSRFSASTMNGIVDGSILSVRITSAYALR